MQIYFTVKVSIKEYIEKGRAYPFPEPPLRRCHNHKCSKIVQYKKHGFYERHLITAFFKDKISIRRCICPLCGYTISYLPDFCLPRFIHTLKDIFTYMYKTLCSKETLKACLEKLNDRGDLSISRQLIYHYKKRLMDNIQLIQMGLRQINSGITLPEYKLPKIKRVKMLLGLIKNELGGFHSFSRNFHEKTNKTILTLCKLL
ncbi:hypothetical protein [Desulfitibacter alkalitolerans]|uniref:hypothetical protein n=1 Tax=Desulfitibacter alkalitolerans TaxID=264641 RepID=UPI000687A0F9|nr:hypothetical protein [Desulfitibacter alkalitolerans]